MPEPKSGDWVYKILRVPEWHAFQSSGRLEGSPDDLRDGFIHLSSAAQVSGTLERYFGSEDEIVLVRVAALPLGSALKWEAARDGTLFPHLFRALHMNEVAEAQTLRRGPNGFDLSAVAGT